MDIRDRVMGDKPNDFLHKIAGIVPGFNGYMDRERRRDADKLLRVYLAHQYSDVRARITRVQQTMVRGKNLGLYCRSRQNSRGATAIYRQADHSHLWLRRAVRSRKSRGTRPRHALCVRYGPHCRRRPGVISGWRARNSGFPDFHRRERCTGSTR